MLGPTVESTAVGSSTFANKIGSGGTYDDDNLLSNGLVQAWDGGIGKRVIDGGFYYAQLDTRRPTAILPPQVAYTNLPNHAISTVDKRTAANCAHFVEVGERLYMFKGEKVYLWSENNRAFWHVDTLDVTVTSAAYFDGYIHIAGRRSGGSLRYIWFKMRGHTYEKGEGAVDLTNVYIFYPFGGLLYCARGNEVRYTSGSDTEMNNLGYPKEPQEWEWSDPIICGGFDENINGIAGLLYQTLGQRYLYVSTRSFLSVVIPGDLPVTITEWPMASATNGNNMETFYNRVYTPVGRGLVAIQTNGDVIDIGTDNGEGLPCDVAGGHQDVITSASYPMVVIAGESPTVWANKASGWHFMARLTAGTKPVNGWHSSIYGRTFVCLDNGTVAHWYAGDTTLDPRLDTKYRYEQMGVIDSGWYRGALFGAKKYWRNIFVDAQCVGDKTSIEVRYITDDEDTCGACEEIDYDTWHLAGYVTEAQPEVELNIGHGSKAIRWAIILRTTDHAVTPVIRAMGIRYIPKIINHLRWQFTVRLPDNCLNGIDGSPIPGYDQSAYDERLLTISEGEEPVPFTDIDGRQYKVLVTNIGRRVHNVRCASGGIVFDLDWSMSLVQTWPEGVSRYRA